MTFASDMTAEELAAMQLRHHSVDGHHRHLPHVLPAASRRAPAWKRLRDRALTVTLYSGSVALAAAAAYSFISVLR